MRAGPAWSGRMIRVQGAGLSTGTSEWQETARSEARYSGRVLTKTGVYQTTHFGQRGLLAFGWRDLVAVDIRRDQNRRPL